MRVFVKSLCAFLLMALFCTCSGERPARPQNVAVLLQTSTNPFFQQMWEGIESEATRHNMNVDLYWPERVGDFDYQYDILTNKAPDYDVLIFSPSDPNTMSKYLPPLKRGGTKILLVDAPISVPPGADEKDYFDVFTGTDNELGGELAAAYAKDKLGTSPHINVLAGFENTIDTPGRVRSFIDSVRKTIPDARLRVFTGDYDQDIAEKTVRENLPDFASSDLIYCANDYMAMGMMRVLKSAKLARMPIVIGYDSMLEAQQAILSGEMDASVVQFPSRMGREAVKIAVALTAGEDVPHRIILPPRLSVRRLIIDTLGEEDLLDR